MTDDPINLLDRPIPFVKALKPDPDEHFLSFEFTPEDLTHEFNTDDATGTGTRYKTDDGRLVIVHPSNLHATEISPVYLRYTVSVPSNSFTTLDDYLTEARTTIQNSMPISVGQCNLLIHFLGKNAAQEPSETGITDWLETQCNADTVVTKRHPELNNIISFIPVSADTHSL